MFLFQPVKYTKDLSIGFGYCIYIYKSSFQAQTMPNQCTSIQRNRVLTLVRAANLFQPCHSFMLTIHSSHVTHKFRNMSLSNDSILFAVMFSSANFTCLYFLTVRIL
jgi:hypothetical protein